MIIKSVFDIKCEDCVYYRGKQLDGLILCSVPEGRCYKFHEAEIPPQTNGDKIREMSNEELAAFLEEWCPPAMRHNWLDWLNAGAEEDN